MWWIELFDVIGLHGKLVVSGFWVLLIIVGINVVLFDFSMVKPMSSRRWIAFWIAIAISVISLMFAMSAMAQSHHPPADYDYQADNMDVRIMPLALVQRLCALLARHEGDRSLIQGCALPHLRPCIVLLPPDASDWVYKHERAHCNGWRH